MKRNYIIPKSNCYEFFCEDALMNASSNSDSSTDTSSSTPSPKLNNASNSGPWQYMDK